MICLSLLLDGRLSKAGAFLGQEEKSLADLDHLPVDKDDFPAYKDDLPQLVIRENDRDISRISEESSYSSQTYNQGNLTTITWTSSIWTFDKDIWIVISIFECQLRSMIFFS